MKTFKDLQFDPHKVGVGTHAQMYFDNGYGVSVVCGELFYSNGIDTYETDITSDVLGDQTADEVSEIMRRVQKLK